MPKSKLPDLSIVIPAFSEERRIGKSLRLLAKFLSSDEFMKTIRVEVVIVVPETNDRTLEIVEETKKSFTNCRIILPGQSRGKGGDVRAGMLAANGRRIIFMDADMATPLWHIQQFYGYITKECEIIVGTRDLSKYRRGVARRLISLLGNVGFRLVSGINIEDSQCGFKLFTNKACRLCFSNLQIHGWSFDMEVLTIAKANGVMFRSVRLDDWADRPYSTFNENSARVIYRSLIDLGHIFYNKVCGSYVDRNL